jgi:hypothetical protein
MKKLFNLPTLILAVVLLFSCGQKTTRTIDPETYARYRQSGNEISGQTQGVLLSNVSKAMQKGGSVYAVEFCNLQASGLVDSLNAEFNCEISRVTNKNRNPENNLETSTDRKIWDYFSGIQENEKMHDTLVQNKEKIIYYKPILTAMPACLQCHGTVEEIKSETYKKIQTLYPEDKATGYALNELRGLWKIESGKK